MTSITRLSALATAATLTLGAGAALAVETTTPQLLVSDEEVAANPNGLALAPHIVHNPDRNEYLAAWSAATATVGEFEIGARRLAPDGTALAPGFPVSDRGDTSGGTSPADHDSTLPRAVYNTNQKQYLIVWLADHQDQDFEVWGEIIDADGNTIVDDFPISRMGGTSSAFTAGSLDAAYDPVGDRYLVVWSGDHDTLVDDENEIWGSVVSATGTVSPMQRYSRMGPDNNDAYTTINPDVVYNPKAQEFAITWTGTDNTGALAHDEAEIYVRRVAPNGAPIGAKVRVSDAGNTDGSSDYTAASSTIAANTRTGEYMVTWIGDDEVAPLVDDELEVFGQRLGPELDERGPNDFRISDIGSDGDTVRGVIPASFSNVVATWADISYNAAADEYVVVWSGDDASPLEYEIQAQRLAPDGSDIGPNDVIVSDTPGPARFAFAPRLAHNAVDNDYMVIWNANTPSATEFEVYARRLKGGDALVAAPPTGTPPGGGVPGTTGAPAAPNCAPELQISTSGGGGTIALTTTQLRINQNIGSAAVRRANAIEEWLNDGIVGSDICGGALAPDQFHSGVAYTTGPLNPLATVAAPRPLVIPKAQDKGNVAFTLTTAQLKTNQNIYSAAVRRANALKERIEGKLTGGDLTDGTLAPDRARQDLYLGALTPASPPPAASVSNVAPASTAGATFTLTEEQLAINQRIAQAAVTRTNDLRVLISAGLRGDNFADGTITAQDWASAP